MQTQYYGNKSYVPKDEVENRFQTLSFFSDDHTQPLNIIIINPHDAKKSLRHLLPLDSNMETQYVKLHEIVLQWVLITDTAFRLKSYN